jgi:macrolide transport system ATP-binding/permease protein
VQALPQDLRQALRGLARRPWLALVAVVSLAAGIGVNVVVFTWTAYLVLAPVPGVDVGGLSLLEPRTDTGAYPGMSWLEVRDVGERLKSVSAIAAWRSAPVAVGDPGRSERVFAQLVSGRFFDVLGLSMARGRALGPADADARGGPAVVVVSHDFWQSRLGGTDAVIGATVRVNGVPITVVGVTPARFQGTVVGLGFDLWLPATLAPTLFAGADDLDDRQARGYSVMARLAPRVSYDGATGELRAVMAGLARTHPGTNTGIDAEVLPFWKTPRGPQRMLAQGLAALQALLLVLLAAVCANLASLLLARSADRRREVGVRLALGARRAAVVRALLWEPAILAALGSALGVVLAVWGTEALRTLPLPGNFPFRFQTRVDGAAVAAACALGVVAMLLFGGPPAAQLARLDPLAALRGVRAGSGGGRLRRALMGAQVALAVVVLAAAGLILRGVADGRQDDPGFRRDGLLLAAYDLTGRDTDAGRFAQRVLDAVRGAPGVAGVAIASAVPLDIHGLPPRPFSLEGRTRTDGGTDRARSNVVTPGYFEVMGIPFREGRDFVPLADTAAPAEAVVNEAFVARFIAPAPPLGRRIDSGERAYRIVGVVATTVSDAFGEPPTPALYFSLRDRRAAIGEVHVRVAPGREALAAAAVRTAIGRLDPTLPVYDVRTMAEHLERNLVFRLVPARMMRVLAPLLLALAALGIYGVVAHVVTQRTAEIGVRIALGASGPRVVRDVVGETLRVAVGGALAGLTLAAVLSFDVLGGGARDVPVLAVATLLPLGVAAVAGWLPARRAAAVDPVRALRHD